MPIYEYVCRLCRHRFDLRQGFDADPVTACPHCNGEASRQFHSVAIVYKGSGFYTTDYKRRSFSPAGKNGSHDDKEEEKSAPTSAEESTA